MSERDDGTTFDGGLNGITCEVFIRGIRQSALVQNKHKDDEWIASYAASRMDGPALLWLEDQSDEVQESWKLLRKALMQRWLTTSSSAGDDLEAPVSSDDVPAAPPASHIPTPAAAPPPPGSTNTMEAVPAAPEKDDSASGTAPEVEDSFSLPPYASAAMGKNPTVPSSEPVVAPMQIARGLSTSSKLPGPWKGRLQILSLGGNVLGYVSKALDDSGFHAKTNKIADAIIVEFVPSNRLHEIRIDTSSGTEDSLLGMSWTPHGLFEKALRRKYFGGLATLTRTKSGKTRTSSSIPYAESTSEIWSVLVDRTVIPSSIRLPDLEIAVHRNGNLRLTENYDLHVEEWESPNWQRGTIVFDPEF